MSEQSTETVGEKDDAKQPVPPYRPNLDIITTIERGGPRKNEAEEGRRGIRVQVS